MGCSQGPHAPFWASHDLTPRVPSTSWMLAALPPCHWDEEGRGACPLVFTLVEDVHTWLVGADDFQDFAVRGEDPGDVPVMLQQLLGRLQRRDACRHHQPVLDFRLGGPVKGGVINLCKERGTWPQSPTQPCQGCHCIWRGPCPPGSQPPPPGPFATPSAVPGALRLWACASVTVNYNKMVTILRTMRGSCGFLMPARCQTR